MLHVADIIPLLIKISFFIALFMKIMPLHEDYNTIFLFQQGENAIYFIFGELVHEKWLASIERMLYNSITKKLICGKNKMRKSPFTSHNKRKSQEVNNNDSYNRYLNRRHP